MKVEKLLKDKREEILQLATKHGAYNVRIFGSVARGEANEDSDIDFLINVKENHSRWFPGSLLSESRPASRGSSAMQSIKLHSRVGSDGILHLDIPLDLRDKDIEVMVIFQPVETSTQVKNPQDLGWMPGFFEEVIGGWVGEPLVRPEQEEYETRETLF